MRVYVGLVEVVDGRVHEARGVRGLHDGQRLGGVHVAGEGVIDAPVVKIDNLSNLSQIFLFES